VFLNRRLLVRSAEALDESGLCKNPLSPFNLGNQPKIKHVVPTLDMNSTSDKGLPLIQTVPAFFQRIVSDCEACMTE
jgi:hypothetical protein